MAILGYDDVSFAASAAVPLSSIRQPRRDLGRRAAELLFAEIETSNNGERHEHQAVRFSPRVGRSPVLGSAGQSHKRGLIITVALDSRQAAADRARNRLFEADAKMTRSPSRCTSSRPSEDADVVEFDQQLTE